METPTLTPRRGVLLGILGGGVPPRSPNPDTISDQKVLFSVPDFIFHIIITYTGAQPINSSNPFRIRTFLFLSYSFRIETINTFIHSYSSLAIIPHSRPKWVKCIPAFRPKRCKNPTRWGGGGTHNYIAYIREYPPGL